MYKIFYAGEYATISDLKGAYCNLRPAEGDFPPVPTFSFTNLALIKDTLRPKKVPFSMRLFKVLLMMSLKQR